MTRIIKGCRPEDFPDAEQEIRHYFAGHEALGERWGTPEDVVRLWRLLVPLQDSRKPRLLCKCGARIATLDVDCIGTRGWDIIGFGYCWPYAAPSHSAITGDTNPVASVVQFRLECHKCKARHVVRIDTLTKALGSAVQRDSLAVKLGTTW